MAKGNLILGTAVGKLGDAVLFRQDGQQRSRVRVRKIGNPKTQSQAVNRALLNTLSAAYTYMKGIVDHSFQGLSKPVENQRKFAKLNQGIARATGSVAVPGTDTGYNFNFKGETLLRPNPYAISRGTMPGVEVSNIAQPGAVMEGFKFNQVLSELIDVPTTYKQFCDAIGVDVGAQLTFCIINDDTFTGEPSESNMPKAYGNFHYARIILSDDSGNGDVPMFVSDSGDMRINPAYANSRNEGTLFFDRIGENTVRIVVNGKADPLAMGVIVSNYSSRMWLRSNTDMVVAEGYQDSNTMSEVYASYMLQEETPSSDLYLNQGEGTRAGGGGTVTSHKIIMSDDETAYYPTEEEDSFTIGTLTIWLNSNSPIVNPGSSTVTNGGLAPNPQRAASMLMAFGLSDAQAYELAAEMDKWPSYVYAVRLGSLQLNEITLQNGYVLKITQQS